MDKPIMIRSSDMPESSNEIKILRRRFEKHLDSHRQDDREDMEKRLNQEANQETMVKSIAELTKAVQPLVDGVTVLVVVQKLVKWLSGFAFIGVVIATVTGNNPFK
tara:strand:+ start:1911 stop:2228 length:318 start_codon:yes stop_codon:yes gene_type:complete